MTEGGNPLACVKPRQAKLLKKKYGKGSDYTKERQSMPKPRTMPAPKKEKTAEDKKKQ